MKEVLKLIPIFLAAWSSGAWGEENLITIRGFNAKTALKEIKAEFPECKETDVPDIVGRENQLFSCGTIGYVITEEALTALYFSCDFVNGCKYSVTELAKELQTTLGLSDPNIISSTPPMQIIEGDAGDALLIGDFSVVEDWPVKNPTLSMGVGDYYKKPELTLE